MKAKLLGVAALAVVLLASQARAALVPITAFDPIPLTGPGTVTFYAKFFDVTALDGSAGGSPGGAIAWHMGSFWFQLSAPRIDDRGNEVPGVFTSSEQCGGVSCGFHFRFEPFSFTAETPLIPLFGEPYAFNIPSTATALVMGFPTSLQVYSVIGFPSRQIYADIQPIPIPAALPLFASGLGLMGLLAWRRKRKAIHAAA